MEKQETNPLWAVWKYDTYPYLKIGEIVPDKDGNILRGKDGYVHIKGYDAMGFKPLKIMAKAQGEELNAAIMSLAVERKNRIGAIETEMFLKLNKVRKDWELPTLIRGQELA